MSGKDDSAISTSDGDRSRKLCRAMEVLDTIGAGEGRARVRNPGFCMISRCVIGGIIGSAVLAARITAWAFLTWAGVGLAAVSLRRTGVAVLEELTRVVLLHDRVKDLGARKARGRG